MRRHEALTAEQERELDALDRAIGGEPVELELRELEELVRDVRATAPEVSPAFAARLEQEVQDGFPTPQERVPVGVRPWRGRRWMLLPAVGSLAAVLVALVVVLGNTDDPVTTFSGEATVPAQRDGAAESAASAGDAGGAADRAPSVGPGLPAPPAGTVAPGATRKVERSAVLALRTPDDEFERTTAAVLATVARFEGIVAASQIGDGDAAGGEAFYDLRIPTERLDRALAALSKLGHLTERSQSLQDITASFRSAQERLTDARAERRGLLRALERATTQNRIDSLKAQLRTVSSRIAGLKGRLAALRRRADLSRVDLTVRSGGRSAGATGAGGSWMPGDAAGNALRVLEVGVGVLLVSLAVLVPAALLGAAIALAVRLARRRRREAALDPA